MNQEAYSGADVQFFGIRRMVDEMRRITVPMEVRDMFSMRRRGSVAFKSIHIAGLGNGVFVFPAPKDVVTGRRLDELGRVVIPFRIAQENSIFCRNWVEMIPMHLAEHGYGLFVHSVANIHIGESEEA